MKLARFACLIPLIALTTILLAQSDSVPTRNQRSLSRTSSESGLRQREVTSDQTLRRTMHSQMAGLNFEPAVAYASGGQYASSVAVADVNGDGKPDLMVTNGYCGSGCTNGTVAVLLGNGDGTFQAAVSYNSGGFGAQSVVVADVNGDGKLDLLVANDCVAGSNCDSENRDGTAAVLLGNGDGTFQAAVAYDSGGVGASRLVVGDVNNDGKPDVIVVNSCGFSSDCGGSSYPANGTVGVLLGNGDGTFQTAVTYASGGQVPSSIALGDLNGDGKPDLVVGNSCAYSNSSSCEDEITPVGVVGVMLGNGDGTFQTAVAYGPGGDGAFSATIEDMNSDGKPDLLVVTQPCVNNTCFGDTAVAVLVGNGDGTFKTAVTFDSGGPGTSLAVADVNGDTKPDLVVSGCDGGCSSDGAVIVLLGNGDGTFMAALMFASGGIGPGSVAAADVNKDGKTDLLVANGCTNSTCVNGSISVLINISTEATTTALLSSLNPSGVGQTVSFTATVTPQGTGLPTGTVTFFDGPVNLGSPYLNGSGVALMSTSTLSVGTHSITAVYSGDSNFAGSTSPVLSELVQGAIALLAPAALNFGNQTVGITSAPQYVTLTNSGNVALNITSISLAQSNGSFGEANTCGKSLAAGSTCTVTLSWTPGTAGNMTGSMSLTDNAPNTPQSVSLTGAGVLPAVSLSPAKLTFSTQIVFTTSKAQTVTLTNNGLGILDISKISVTGPFSQTNTCGMSVAAGATCTFTVTFKPTTISTLTGSISITDNAPASPQKIALTGMGTYVQLSTASLNFGNQPVGTKSLPKKITLSNKGSVAVNITSVSITGADIKDFAQTNTCGKSVASGASCVITVTFTPAAKGNRTAAISVSDNGGGSPQKVTLAGTGT